MRKAIGVLMLIGCLLATAAKAQQGPPYRFGALGYCQISSLATAVTVTQAACSTFQSYIGAAFNPIAVATIIQICVSGQAIRYASNPALTPTASVGMPVAASTCFQYSGPIQNLRMIQQAISATVDIEFFQ
jgi:hypothetical protein